MIRSQDLTSPKPGLRCAMNILRPGMRAAARNLPKPSRPRPLRMYWKQFPMDGRVEASPFRGAFEYSFSPLNAGWDGAARHPYPGGSLAWIQ